MTEMSQVTRLTSAGRFSASASLISELETADFQGLCMFGFIEDATYKLIIC